MHVQRLSYGVARNLLISNVSRVNVPTGKTCLPSIRSKGLIQMRMILKITGEIRSGPGDLFGMRDLRCFRSSPEVQEMTSRFPLVGSKEGRFARSSVVNKDEKDAFKLLVIL